jgi:hypothetical protein
MGQTYRYCLRYGRNSLLGVRIRRWIILTVMLGRRDINVNWFTVSFGISSTEPPAPATTVYYILITDRLSLSWPVSDSLNQLLSHLGGVMVSVLANGPKVHGFKPGRGDGFFKCDRISSTPSFGGEVKPSVPCRKILRHVKKITLKHEQRYFKILLLCY